jgi:hypothetical protein
MTEQKKPRGRPRKDTRYMEETCSWQVRLNKKTLLEFNKALANKSVQKGKRVFANSVIVELIEGWIEQNGDKENVTN